MSATYAVFDDHVTKNGSAIPGYISHIAWVRAAANESNGALEVGLVIRVDNAKTEAVRDAQVAVLPEALQETLDQENSLRPTFTEIRPVAGDTVTFSGIADQVLTGTAGSAGFMPGNSAGTDPL